MKMKQMEREAKRFKKGLKKQPWSIQIRIAVQLNQWIFWCDLKDLPDFTLEWYARLLDVSPPYVSRCFSRHFERSFQKVLNQRKMMDARRLLREEPKLSLDVIGAKVGYCTGNYFIKVFKKECGITPYQYRKQLKFDANVPINQWHIIRALQEDINEFIYESTGGKFEEAVTIHGGALKAPKKKKRRKPKKSIK